MLKCSMLCSVKLIEKLLTWLILTNAATAREVSELVVTDKEDTGN